MAKKKQPDVENVLDDPVLSDAKSKFARAEEEWAEVYKNATDDLYFLSDVEGAQWDPRAWAARQRRGRPALTLDQLDKICNQVVNDERMSTPSINIIPDGSGAELEDAEIFQGIIRNIEYQSEADTAYDTAAEFAVKCSIGFIDVVTEYEDEQNGFNQQLSIRRVTDPMSRYIDPDSKLLDGSDAMWGFRLNQIQVADFKEQYPGKQPVNFGGDVRERPARANQDVVTIADFFNIEEEQQHIGLRINPEDLSPVIEEVDDDQEYMQTRKITKRLVRHYKVSGQDVLEETVFPGKYVPIVPMYGREMWRDGKRYVHSLIRKAKEPQMMYNLLKSTEMEVLMRQPRANFTAPALAVADYAKDWKNPENVAVLMYNHVDKQGNPIPPPQRQDPPVFPQGLEIAAQGSAQNIKDATGIYNASTGDSGPEVSGIAIQRKQQDGDVATFHFTDNRVKAITQVGRILVFAIPEVMDTPRIVQMIDEEENPEPVGINGAMAPGQERPIDLKKGKFSVKVITGASYTTKRQEEAAFIQQVIQADPALMNIIGDLLFENKDTPGAQAIANRLKKMMPPQLQDDNQDPQVAALQHQLQQATQALQQMQAQLQAATNEQQLKQGELALKNKEIDSKTQLGAADLQLKQQDMQADAQGKQYDLAMKQKDLEIKQMELEIKRIEAEAKLQQAQVQHSTALLSAVKATAPTEIEVATNQRGI